MSDVASTAGSQDARAVCLVLDTNIWRSTFLLRTIDGAALLHYLRRCGGVLGLPEVIEREIVKHAVLAGNEALENVRRGLSAIQCLTGSAPSPQYSTTDFADCARRRLSELESFAERVPFTLEHARAALDRVDAESPPNKKGDQQFKDSAIWEAVIVLGSRYDVVLVSADKAFYEQRAYEKGPAKQLLDEASEARMSFSLFSDIGQALFHLRQSAPDLDRSDIVQRVDSAIREFLPPWLERFGVVAITELIAEESGLEAFATEAVDTLLVHFEFRYSAVEGPELATPVDCSLSTTGVCSVNSDTGLVTDLRIDRLEVSNPRSGRRDATVFVHPMGMTLGQTPPDPLRIRSPID